MMDIADLLIIHVMLHLVSFRLDIFYLFDTCKEFKLISLKVVLSFFENNADGPAMDVQS